MMLPDRQGDERLRPRILPLRGLRPRLRKRDRHVPSTFATPRPLAPFSAHRRAGPSPAPNRRQLGTPLYHPTGFPTVKHGGGDAPLSEAERDIPLPVEGFVGGSARGSARRVRFATAVTMRVSRSGRNGDRPQLTSIGDLCRASRRRETLFASPRGGGRKRAARRHVNPIAAKAESGSPRSHPLVVLLAAGTAPR